MKCQRSRDRKRLITGKLICIEIDDAVGFEAEFLLVSSSILMYSYFRLSGKKKLIIVDLAAELRQATLTAKIR